MNRRGGPPKGFRGDLATRFDRKTIPEPNSGCLIWIGAVRPHGYGKIQVDGSKQTIQATHAALLLSGRIVPKGKDACHACDNPYCVNVDHLFIGTRQENMADCIRKGRADFSGLSLGRGR